MEPPRASGSLQKCRIFYTVKIKEFDPNQVHMAPFELIFNQNESYRVWEASGMPPEPQNPVQKIKNPGFRGLGDIQSIPPYSPLRALGVGGMGEAS